MCLERETHLCIGILTSMTNAGCAHSKLTMWPPQPASRALQTSGLELETKVHPKVRNHGEGPY